MSGHFDARAATASLRDFQRATVDHVAAHLFAAGGSRRFLVADETGLGKSLVARGLVARTIERFEHDDAIDRIDVVYVCSSTELARQNLRRLDCAGLLDVDHRVGTDRLSLLALAGDDFDRPTPGLAKPVNLVAFTPGTSFDHGSAWGQARERALIACLIERERDWTKAERRRLRLAFTGNAHKGFAAELGGVRAQIERRGVNEEIARRFIRAIRNNGLWGRLRRLLVAIGQKRSVPEVLLDRSRDICSQMRAQLARASVDTLEPDLVILDEFQRFRHLLDPERGAAAELAHELFGHPDAHVLLLSATPYKPFTLAAEREGEDDDDHYRDLIATLTFLAGDHTVLIKSIERRLADFRRAVTAGEKPKELAEQIGAELRRLMVRTERPPSMHETMVHHVEHAPGIATAGDLVEHVRLRRLAQHVDATLPVDYWKSVPFFANHLDGYRLGTAVKDALADPRSADATRDLLDRLPAIRGGQPETSIEPSNHRYRALERDVLDSGLWRLPWLAPSLPYVESGGAWADPTLSSMTKRLIFSRWGAVPASVATLLSHNAERKMTEGRSIRPRLQYSISDNRPNGMSTLALFWPHPALAALADPLELARRDNTGRLPSELAIRSVAKGLRTGVTSAQGRRSDWESYFSLQGALLDSMAWDRSTGRVSAQRWIARAMLGEPDPTVDVDHSGVDAHLDRMVDVVNGSAAIESEHAEVVAELGLFGPGNIAWRALGSVIRAGDDVPDEVRWVAAAVIADGVRSLFNRSEVAALLDREYGDDDYWRRVLQVCADGNLQAVLEEHLFHLRGAVSAPFLAVDEQGQAIPFQSHELVKLALRLQQALALREARLRLFDPTKPDETFSMPARFAVRYGGKHDSSDDQSARPAEVREAFNSPFWPYVLASTSVGQEGIDFHWWCHAIVHWNLPASPVDFEQREGRVNRFAGHAVRRNVADEHGVRALSEEFAGRPVWDVLWELACDRRDLHGDLSPEWVYTGDHKVQRHVFPYALSTDIEKLERLERSRALYRLAFGQPRQEDMLKLLADRDEIADIDDLRIDLEPIGEFGRPRPRSEEWSDG